MKQPSLPPRDGAAPVGGGQLDRAGVWLSGLCLVHCLAGLLLVGLLGIGGGVLLDPSIHRYGLAAAVAIGLATLGSAAISRRRLDLVALGGAGLALMAGALFVGHGAPEAVLTIAGVSLLATAHLRKSARSLLSCAPAAR